MNKILISTDNCTSLEGVASITVSDGKFVSLIYHNGRTVKYLYNPHFDKDEFGKTQWEKDNEH